MPAQSAAAREMPLTLASPSGFHPTINAPHVQINYEFVVNCDIPMGADICTKLPVVIYTPAPPVSAFAAAFGGAVPQNAAAFV